MSQLSELLTQANREGLSVDQVVERMHNRGHQIGRDTVWKYLTGRHSQRVRRQYLEAFVDVFPGLKLAELLLAARVPPDLGEYTPPAEARSLTRPEREAIDLIIRSMARDRAWRPLDELGRGLGRLIPAPESEMPGPTSITRHEDEEHDDHHWEEAAYTPPEPPGPHDES